MNQVAWGIIRGFIAGVAILAVFGFLFGKWDSKELMVYGLSVFVMIMGALLIGKFCFPF